jgi:hypothetical protein
VRGISIVSATLAGFALASVVMFLPAWASGAERRALDSLQVRVTISGSSGSGAVDCPPGTPEPNECFLYQGEGVVSGLGATTLRFTLVTKTPSPGCELWSSPDLTLTVAAKGRIDLVASEPTCQRDDSPSGSMGFTVTGGSGIYAGARGDGTLGVNQIVGTTKAHFAWDGTITVPGLQFDTTPPTLIGLRNRTVKALRTAKRRLVTYTVKAADTVDGSVPTVCLPRSGSRFKLGRTTVACSAADTSGNVARGKFSVTVTR